MSIIQKNYEKLCKERDSILDEKKFYSQFTTFGHMGLFICERYDYIDELSYIIKRIEQEIIPYEILYKLKLYKKLTQKIPIEVVLYIASFGDLTDIKASLCLEKVLNTNVT